VHVFVERETGSVGVGGMGSELREGLGRLLVEKGGKAKL